MRAGGGRGEWAGLGRLHRHPKLWNVDLQAGAEPDITFTERRSGAAALRVEVGGGVPEL